MKNTFASLSNKLRISLLISVAVLVSAVSINAQATTVSYSGEVLAVEGSALAVIIPLAPLQGTITYADSAVIAGLAGVADIEDISINLGDFCFHIDPSNCASGAFLVQVTSIDTAAVTFSSGIPTGGSMSFTAYALSLDVFATTSLELSAETFVVDAGLLGTVSGTISAVPIPAAAWLFGSALLGLIGVKRKRL